MIGALVLAQLAITAAAPDTVAECQGVTVTVRVEARGTSTPYIIPPDLDPFALVARRGGPRSRVDARGDVWVAAEYHYELIAERAGRYTIGPFEARVSGRSVRSRPLAVVVRGGPPSGASPIITLARIDTTERVNFRALVAPETVYVGQQATYEVAVFLDQQMRERMRRSPSFNPPELRSMLAYDLVAPRAPPRRKAAGRCYDALVYQRGIFPLAPGRHVIPPARLGYSLPLTSGFFAREESFEARTDSVVLMAVEPPAVGRPEDWAGAVGSLGISAAVDSGLARVGNPLRLTVRISGEANMKLLPRPPLRVPWAEVVPAEERVQLDSGSFRVRGAKEFDWLLTPLAAGELELPPIRYPYFNPTSAAYEIAATLPTTLRVAPGGLARAATATPRRAVLTLRERYRGPLPPEPHERGAFWLALFAAPLPAATLLAARRRPPRRAPPARDLERLARKASADPRTLRRAYVAALADRLGVPSEALTPEGRLARRLRLAGVSVQTAADAEILLLELDAAVYAAGPGPADGARRALQVARAVGAEARSRRALGGLARGALLAVLAAPVIAGPVIAGPRLAAASPGERFAAGIAAYARADYLAAHRAFLEAARTEPRAGDAWANAGTAAWAARDTAGAVGAWQRAQRLEPAAMDVRARLALVPGSAWGEPGFVPPVPVGAVALTAAALWIVAWGLSARRARRGRLALGATPAALMLSACTLGALAIRLDERIAGRDRAVVGPAGEVRVLPALAAEPIAALRTGDLVRVVERRNVWARIEATGARAGWVEADRLVGVARD
ncbi:MAG TPA: BatD family protein [Gemmatimonadaceae bacterium]|nr:BatD family protein [Gemmatimonadaceae bacterium]